MTTSPKIAFVCGSLREGSINRKLEKCLMKRAKALGAKVSKVDLGAYDLPLYHGDLPLPAGVKKLIRRLKSFDGVIIVTPEYNGGLPPVLKNAIDWTSTVETGHISGPVYGIAACSPGALSGIMCLRQLNFILMRLGAHVVPKQLGVGNADAAFDAKGDLVSGRTSDLANDMLGQVMERIAQKQG